MTNRIDLRTRFCSARSSSCSLLRINGSSAENGSSMSRIVGVGRERTRQPDALLHAARELVTVAIGPLRESDELELLVDDATSIGGGLAAQFEAEARRSRAPCATAAVRTAGRSSRCARAAAGAASPHRSWPRRPAARPSLTSTRPRVTRIQAVGGAHQRRLARARQTHQHRDLALLDAQARVRHADDHAGRRLDLGAIASLLE